VRAASPGNWAVAKIKANADQWAAEANSGMEKTDRVCPLTFFTPAKMWTAEKPDVAPWAAEHSTWTFRYALREAANAHAAGGPGPGRAAHRGLERPSGWTVA
jgi:putative transposase